MLLLLPRRIRALSGYMVVIFRGTLTLPSAVSAAIVNRNSATAARAVVFGNEQMLL